MNRIPVGRTIRFAYAFTFGEIGTVIGLIWIPTLLNAVIGFFVNRAYYQALADSADSGLPPGGSEAALPFVLVFISMLLLAMIAVAITRQAMGLRQGPAFAHISFGGAELRTFGGYFGLYVLLFAFVFAFVLIVGAAAVALGAVSKASVAPNPAFAVGASLVALIGVFLLVFAMVRLSFLMVPAVLDGREFGLTRSWQLTQGNFWRIVAVALGTLLPAVLIFGALELTVLGPDIIKQQMAMAKDPTASLRHLAEQMQAMQSRMPLLMGLNLLLSPFLYGLSFAPAAFAYRALTEDRKTLN